MNIDAITEEIACLSDMIKKEKKKYESITSPLYERQLKLFNRINEHEKNECLLCD